MPGVTPGRSNHPDAAHTFADIGAQLKALAPRLSDWWPLHVRQDLVAGLMVALVALPLALGFGVSSGLGAGAGIATAIVAGAVAAIFGGSRVQVSGPTGAMTVVLVPVVAAHGAGSVAVVGLMAGLILIVLAMAGAGRAIHYVPLPVIEGFTLGIAAIIAAQQVPFALGATPGTGEKVLPAAWGAVTAWIAEPDWATAGLTAATVLLILLLGRIRPGWPVPLLAVLLATLATKLLPLNVAPIGDIPRGLPLPQLPTVPWGEFEALIMPALAIAALAALESLLSASVADALTIDGRHEPDRELFGQGLANLATPLVGGIPATAAIARTAVNVRAGAVTRLAALSHSVMLLIVLLIAAPWVGEIPLAALAGVLIATAVHMVSISALAPVFRVTRGDGLVLAATAAATLLTNLVTAVIVGLALAGFVALRQTARSARLDSENVSAEESTEEDRLLDQHIVAYRLEGPLFFAAAHDFLLELTRLGDVRVVILRMSHVTTLDATGAHVLADTIRRLESRQVTVLLSGLQPRHTRILGTLGVLSTLAHERHVFATTPDAIAHARAHVARVPHHPTGNVS
ncbi:MAG: SulP family inorganic anion transporter [Nostocoides sp.]